MKIEMTFPTTTRQNGRNLSRATRPQMGGALNPYSQSRSLEMSLAAAPDVRADVVARGRALIADPNYPTPAHLNKIARVLVASGLGR